MSDTTNSPRLLDCGLCYEEQGEEVHPHPECPIGRVAPVARYCRRAAEVEAVQWTGTNAEQLRTFAGSDFDTIDPEDRIEDPDQDAQLLVEASHWVGIKPTDWVVKFEGYFVAKADATFRAVWEPAAVPAPATDQAADVAEAIRAFPFDDFGMDDVSYALEAAPDSQEWVPKLADAVLAVLPASLDRAAVLREAADAVRDGDLGPRGGMSSDYENGWWNSRAAAEDRIRRMADKPRQEEAGRGNPQETPLTADQQVRGVQAWMALDLHQALGWPVDHSATVEHQGRKSWGDWWAELLAGVRNVQMIRRYRGELLEPTAALREAADHVETLTGQAYEHALSDHEIGRANGLETAMRELRRMADEPPQQQSRQWCKCRSCWGWFVEDHPGEDLDELGRDLSWWSGLPEHRDAPAVVAQPDEEA
jgi:hypothetical protein